MLDLLGKYVIDVTPDAHIAKLFDSDTAAGRLPKKLSASSSFMMPTATFVQFKIHTSIADENALFSNALKMEPVEAKEVYGDIIKERPSRSDLRSEQPHCRRSCRRRSKNPMQLAKIARVNNIFTFQNPQKESTTCEKVGIR